MYRKKKYLFFKNRFNNHIQLVNQLFNAEALLLNYEDFFLYRYTCFISKGYCIHSLSQFTGIHWSLISVGKKSGYYHTNTYLLTRSKMSLSELSISITLHYLKKLQKDINCIFCVDHPETVSHCLHVKKKKNGKIVL